MTATQTHHFGQYTLRPATAADLSLATEWTQADPHHREAVKPEFWLKQEWCSDSYLLFDRRGPVFMCRIIIVTETSDPHPCVEMHIQFPPEPEDAAQRSALHYRTAMGMTRGLNWLMDMLRKVRVKEIYFESNSEPLIKFAIGKLGFRQMGNRLARHL